MGISGIPQWLSGKESACNAEDERDTDLMAELGRSPGGGCGNSLQYSCLKNPMDRGGWWTEVPGVAKGQTESLTEAQNSTARAISIVRVLIYRMKLCIFS